MVAYTSTTCAFGSWAGRDWSFWGGQVLQVYTEKISKRGGPGNASRVGCVSGVCLLVPALSQQLRIPAVGKGTCACPRAALHGEKKIVPFPSFPKTACGHSMCSTIGS